MKAIVAVDQNWAIGNRGKLLIHLPGDLNYFKEKTKGKVVVMGRSTLETLPAGKPLRDRINIVLSANSSFHADCEVVRNIESLKEQLSQYDPEDVFVIGGETVYRELLSSCDTVLVTKINAAFTADKYFPNLDEMVEWEMISSGESHQENGVAYQFTEYRRT